jgi:hypothetical protein
MTHGERVQPLLIGKTIIIVVLTVMSGMDPHMISGIWDGLWLSLWLDCVEVGLLGCGPVT